jgi:predicted RNA-binding protein YlxR (DUF448 family)
MDLTECKLDRADYVNQFFFYVNQFLKERVLQMDSYIRRKNLKFSGLADSEKESHAETRNTIIKLWEEKLEIADAKNFHIQGFHRLGFTSDPGKYPRDIIVRFAFFPEREEVWNNRNKLQGTGIYIKEDFCPEIEQRHAKLYPVFKAAKSKNLKSKLIADKLFIEGKRYSVDTLG